MKQIFFGCDVIHMQIINVYNCAQIQAFDVIFFYFMFAAILLILKNSLC